MSKPMVREHDIETDTIIDREMTDTEYAAHLKEQAIYEELKTAQNERIAAKASALSKLAEFGLTEDEVNAIVSA